MELRTRRSARYSRTLRDTVPIGCLKEATCAPPELSPRRDRRRAGMQGRGGLGNQEERRGSQRLNLSHPCRGQISLRDRADIRCCLAGPGAEGGMRGRTGMLMMTIRRNGMGEGTARRHERQGQIDPGYPHCDDGNGCFGGQSDHGRSIFRYSILYAVPLNLSTDRCSRMLHNMVPVARASSRRTTQPVPSRLNGALDRPSPYPVRSPRAWTISMRDARAAGTNPPTTAIKTAKSSPCPTMTADN